MELTTSSLHCSSSTPPKSSFDATIKRRLLLKHNIIPTPKTLHALRKKSLQKSLRRSKKQPPPHPPPQDSSITLHRTISAEFKSLKRNPWESTKHAVVDLREEEGFIGETLNREHLDELKHVLAERNGRKFDWLLDDDVEVLETRDGEKKGVVKLNGRVGEDEKIKFLVKRLNETNLSIEDWKFGRLMKLSGMIFTEMHLLRIVEKLGGLGNWRLAMSVVEWVYSQKDYKHFKSRFVYTKLISVLGKARRPSEALQIFNFMREDCKLYPDMAAYHSIAVTLGQAGLVRELIDIVECMKQKPSKKIKNMKRKDWDPSLGPDLVIFNAVLNACVANRQWKGVQWVLQQIRLCGLKPTETTYGLAMEEVLVKR